MLSELFTRPLSARTRASRHQSDARPRLVSLVARGLVAVLLGSSFSLGAVAASADELSTPDSTSTVSSVSPDASVAPEPVTEPTVEPVPAPSPSASAASTPPAAPVASAAKRTSSPAPSASPSASADPVPAPRTTAPPTVEKPTVSVSGDGCIAEGATGSITAVFGSLKPGYEYFVTVTGNDDALPQYDSSFKAPAQKTWTITFDGVTAGTVYVVTVMPYGLRPASATFTPEPCPPPVTPEIAVATQPCLVPGGAADLVTTASELVTGREYTLSVAGATVDPITFIAGSASETRTFGVPAPGSGYVVTVLDTVSGLSSSTAPVTVAPCPQVGGISVEVTECSLGQATGTVGIVLDELTVGAGYQVEIDGVPYYETPFVATSTTLTLSVPVAPGTHSIRAYDAASPGYVLEATVTVAPCPVTPTVAIDAAACTTPAGTGSITAMLSDLVDGRTYTVEVLQDGQPIAGIDPVTVVGTGPQVARVPALPQDIVFDGLEPGAGYSVRVIDVEAPEANAEADAEVGPCPPVPSIAISITGCDVVAQVSEVTVTPTDLIDGEAYTARLDELTADGPVARDQIDGITDSTPVTFSGVGNGRTYLVTVANEGGDLSASQSITLEECGSVSPTPPLTPPGTPVTPGTPLNPGTPSTPVTPAGVSPTDVTTLAATGTTDGAGAIIAALFALQLGVILVGARALRSRRHS